jgi:UV DNA damage endonuclease
MFYRMPDDLSACLIAGNSEQIAQELFDCQSLIAAIQATIAAHRYRLTMHLAPGLGPAVVADELAERWSTAICVRARVLAALGSPESVLVGHVGGVYGNRSAALERAATRIEQLPDWARRYLVLEPDEDAYNLTDVIWLHERCGTPVVLDLLHHQIHNPQQIGCAEALALALATWPVHMRPKIHLSTQRTEAHLLPEGRSMRILPPRIGQHADFINPFEFIEVVRSAGGLRRFDVMVEAKASDLALLRLREDVQRFAPDCVHQIDGCDAQGGALC